MVRSWALVLGGCGASLTLSVAILFEQGPRCHHVAFKEPEGRWSLSPHSPHPTG